jgi:hypothetical protein
MDNVIGRMGVGSCDLLKRSRVILGVAALVACVASLGFTNPVSASTPDGETPANEGVCDGLKADGITKGLYGLCVAYCEAQDLDTVGDKETPNNKILRNYRKKMDVAAGDPDMPCVKVPCPCWSDVEFSAGAVNFDSATSFCDVGTIAQVRNFVPALQFAVADPGRPSCRLTDRVNNVSWRFSEEDTSDPVFDPASWQTCYDDIAALCP